MVHLKLFFFLYSTAIAQTFQTYPNHQAAFDYQRLITKTSEECQAACTSDPKCVTYNPTSTGCYLSSTDKHTFYCTNATLFRKQNRSQCGTTVCTSSQECPRLNSVTEKCTDGFSCSCQCFTANDCEQNQLDLGCNTCSNLDPLTGFGTCTPSSATITPRPVPNKSCNYKTTKNTLHNTALSTNLNVVIIFDTTSSWSKSSSQFASLFINNLTVTENFAKISFIRAGVPVVQTKKIAAAVLVNLTTNNSTLNRVLSMAPTQSVAATIPTDPYVDALQLAASVVAVAEPGRRSVLLVVSNAMPVNACAAADPVSVARELSQKLGIEIISVATGTQVSSTQAMIGTTLASSIAIGNNPTSASEMVIALLLKNHLKDNNDNIDVDAIPDLCGRRCLGNLHCLSYRNNSATCALCNGDGTCGQGSCALPIPSKPMNANVSKQLEMVFVVDVGNPSTAHQAVSYAGTLGLNFTNAKIGIVTYSTATNVSVSQFPMTTVELSQLTCTSPECKGSGTGGLSNAINQAGLLLNQSSTKWTNNNTGPLQVVVVVSSQVRANLNTGQTSNWNPTPVKASRHLWADGIQVFSLIADQLCTYGSAGYSEEYECYDANMLGAVDGAIHTIDLRKTTVPLAATSVSDAIIDSHRKLPTCNWKEFEHREIALAFREFHVDSQGTCVERCCRHRRCKAATVVTDSSKSNGLGGGVYCRLHDRWQIPFTLPSAVSSIFRKEDNTGCNRYCLTDHHCQFTGCGKCNFLFNKCDAGYKCGCSCTQNTDCDTSEMDLSCSLCVDKDQSGYGRCRSKQCGQKCVKDSDCSDAQSCPKCTANKCSPKTIPDPIPANCVLPFPGHPHKNCSTRLDLMLLLDGSGSIGLSAWKKILHFTAGIGLNFTTGDDFMNYGIVEFSGTATTFLPLTNSNASFQQVVATLPYFSESTNTFSGFQAIEKEFNAHSRVDAFKVMIILTDGEWNDGGDPLPISKRLKANNTKIFTIAVGEAATKKIAALASLPLSKYYYNVTNEQFLPTILHKMILGLCDRDDENGNADADAGADERAASEKYTKQLLSKQLLVAKQQQKSSMAKKLSMEYVASKRRLDWSNITATETFDCGDDNSSRWIVVENLSLNPIRIRTCNVDYNKQVCKGTPLKNQTGYTQCAPQGNKLAFIAPSTTAVVRIPLNVTYLVVLYCVNNPGRSIHCLSTPTPLEFYKKVAGFPVNGLVVPKESNAFCSVDVDCHVGILCNTTSHMCG